MKTVILTTPGATARQEQVKKEMLKWGIDFEFYYSKPAETTEVSCSNAHQDILIQNKDEAWLMVLEDDVYFDVNPLTIKIPPGFWQYYFGGYMTSKPIPLNNEWNITHGNSGGYCTIYSRDGLTKINVLLPLFKTYFPRALDDWFNKVIHPLGMSLIYKIFIAHTHPGISLITNDMQDHDRDIINQYKKWTGQPSTG